MGAAVARSFRYHNRVERDRTRRINTCIHELRKITRCTESDKVPPPSPPSLLSSLWSSTLALRVGSLSRKPTCEKRTDDTHTLPGSCARCRSASSQVLLPDQVSILATAVDTVKASFRQVGFDQHGPPVTFFAG